MAEYRLLLEWRPDSDQDFVSNELAGLPSLRAANF